MATSLLGSTFHLVAVMSSSDSSSSDDPTTSKLRSRSPSSARRLAANRQNALKSTGPRSRAGKYRSSLNLQSRSLMPAAVERELRARGEDPREFCRLHRDLAAIFRPSNQAVSAAVAMLAGAWWQKARRIRQWVGAGTASCADLDSRIEDLLVLVIDQMRKRHQHWIARLGEAVGIPIGSPAEVRRGIEDQLKLFGGRPRAGRSHPKAQQATRIEGPEETLVAYLERELQAIMAEKAAPGGRPKADQSHQG